MANSGEKHVIVTGGAGFIGSHLCDRLLEKGYFVTALDNFVTGSRANVAEALRNPKFQLVDVDVSKPLSESDFDFLERHGLDGVLHFACPASPVDFDRIPFEILAVDSYGTFHTVDLALRFNARYVIASTSEVYGDPLVHPQTESYWGNVNSIGPRACYDEAKRFGEAVVSTAIRGVGQWNGKSGYRKLNGGIVRIFNTYGPRMRPDDGRVVPELCVQALHGKKLSIHGDGKQTRSFCYVDDLVEGILRYFESSETAPTNIGNPVERTILEFAQVVRDLTGAKSSIEHLPGRTDDPKRRCPDITRAKKVLGGWTPKVDLQDGLARTIEYFRSVKA
jgi:dTDP-glucose 4,6-dehydratase